MSKYVTATQLENDENLYLAVSSLIGDQVIKPVIGDVEVKDITAAQGDKANTIVITMTA
jgi:hypothetical protein